jgi:hypothetical protein
MQNDEARHRKIELADLINEPWCLPSLESFRWYLVADTFRARGSNPPPYPVGITTTDENSKRQDGYVRLAVRPCAAWCSCKARWQFGKEFENLRSTNTPTDHHRAIRINAVNLKGIRFSAGAIKF